MDSHTIKMFRKIRDKMDINSNPELIGKVYKAFLSVLEDGLLKDLSFKLPGIGTLLLRRQKERVIRCPFTKNNQAHIPERFRIFFKPSGRMKALVKARIDLEKNWGLEKGE